VIELDVAVVGGGFSGCAVAANLARSAPPGFSLTLFEPEALGRGAAYGTLHREHLLNTRAHAMSLFTGDADHFVRWLGGRAGRMDFVSRRLYGDYIGEVVARTLERSQFTHVADRVVRLRSAAPSGFTLEASSGARFAAQAVVLATGNAAPNDEFLPVEMRLHPGYVGDPWRFDYRAVGGQVLVIGSGLTALDVLVGLQGNGHRGTVHVLSRHGRYPETHAEIAPYDVVPALDTNGARNLLRSFRRHVAEASDRGFDWRAVVDALRPEAEAIWRRLAPAEQLRFERHLRTRWDRRRHRAPQEVDAVRKAYERSGRLLTYAGRLLQMEDGRVTIELRGGESVVLRPDWIFNCTGVGRSRALSKNPLLAAMLTDGYVAPDSRGLGLRATADLTAIDRAGNVVPGLWLVGPLVRGSRFEATAVPELRLMAASVSSAILRAFRSDAHKAGDRQADVRIAVSSADGQARDRYLR
jgi:uncharacterized NAD(P)/FAD-binding protein YdhS